MKATPIRRNLGDTTLLQNTCNWYIDICYLWHSKRIINTTLFILIYDYIVTLQLVSHRSHV
jgi:hypothetical protein